jgi:hypothetical protein
MAFGGRTLLEQVIRPCGRCGFDIPLDAPDCPTCERDAVPTLPALQVAGVALPTRSLHRLPTTAPRRERSRRRRLGQANGARSAFGYATLLIALALLGVTSSWVAGLERFALTVPAGTVEGITDATELATWAAVIAAAAGLVAMTVWCLQRAAVNLVHREPQR